MMETLSAAPLQAELPQELRHLCRGGIVGELEGFTGSGGLAGWVCRWPGPAGEAAGDGTPGDQSLSSPLPVVLTLEDLLHPGRNWRLAELTAQRPRPDLSASGLARDCGFLFPGHSGVELPEHSPGLVVRAFALTPQASELVGSPLRLSSASYARLRELCRLGLGRAARLTGLEGHQLRGWARGDLGLQLRCDGAISLPINPPDPLPPDDWPIELTLPTSLCDGGIHHLRLEQRSGGGAVLLARGLGVEDLAGEIEAGELRIAVLEELHDPQGLGVVAEATVGG
jgi:hypothetical protein